MLIVIGLGNPGKKYALSRHNAGFMFVDKLSEFLGWDAFYDVDSWGSDNSPTYVVRRARSGGDVKVTFMKPLTFMNLSGSAVKNIVEREGIAVSSSLILVHDDLDIELGKYKIQRSVAPKNHRGVRSVEQSIAKTDFLRVRLGVDSRKGDRSIPPDEYVIQPMAQEELLLLNETIDEAVRDLRSLVQF